MVVLGGEQTPNAELMELSTVPVGVAAEAHRYLAEGGPANLAQLHAFLSDTVLLTGEGFEPPQPLPDWGVLPRPRWLRCPSRPVRSSLSRPPEAWSRQARPPKDELDHPKDCSTTEGRARPPEARVGVLFYRAHDATGNNAFAHALADAIDATGEAVGVPIFCSSLRAAPDELLARSAPSTRWSSPCWPPAAPSRPRAAPAATTRRGTSSALAALDIPVLQGLCLTSSRAEWAASDDGVTPLDSATQVAIPEFDGRIITAPFSFKEIDDDGLPRYVADPERCARVAGIAVAHARLRHIPREKRRIALMLSAYPTKHSRVGNAVGLDTPVSADPAAAARCATRATTSATRASPVSTVEDDTEAGDALIHALIAAGGQDEEWLTAGAADRQPRADPGRRRTDAVGRPTSRPTCATTMIEAWGEAPGSLFVNDGDEIVLATLQAGNVVLLIQPPRGFGENPVAIYHDPDLPPTHHYLAAYRWLEEEFGAHAVVHLGKHGSLEWLPGKNAALSASCAHRRRDRQPAAGLPVPGQRPGRGRAGQAPRARDHRRPPGAADGARRVVRRHRPARAAARRARQHRRDGPGQAAGDPRRRSGR